MSHKPCIHNTQSTKLVWVVLLSMGPVTKTLSQPNWNGFSLALNIWQATESRLDIQIDTPQKVDTWIWDFRLSHWAEASNVWIYGDLQMIFLFSAIWTLPSCLLVFLNSSFSLVFSRYEPSGDFIIRNVWFKTPLCASPRVRLHLQLLIPHDFLKKHRYVTNVRLCVWW